MKIFRYIIVLVWMSFGGTDTGRAQAPAGTYAFDRTSHDFGTLEAGQAADTVFTLTNTGDVPLILLDVKVSCDCARIRWPRQPILPGGSASLTVVYKDRRPGAFYKTVDVVTNGIPRRTQLRLKGSVEKQVRR